MSFLSGCGVLPIFSKKANIGSKLFVELFRGSVAKVTEVACPAVAGTTFHSSTTVGTRLSCDQTCQQYFALL